MPPGSELSPQTRARLCELGSIGWSARRIHAKHPEIPISTIRTTLRRESQRVNNTSKKRSGRPRSLTEEQRDYIYDIVTNKDPHIKMRDLLHEVDDVAKKRSVQRLLREMNLRKWIQKKRPFITPEHAAARLDWAIRHQAYTLVDWKKVLWSDECTVERGVGVKPTWTFVRPRDQLREGDIQAVRASGKGVKKMLWACFRDNLRSGLVPLDGDPEAPRGGVTSWVISALYESYLPDMMAEGGEFMHDGAGPHRGRIVVAKLQELGIRIIIWPPYSTDLNPIENL